MNSSEMILTTSILAMLDPQESVALAIKGLIPRFGFGRRSIALTKRCPQPSLHRSSYTIFRRIQERKW